VSSCAKCNWQLSHTERVGATAWQSSDPLSDVAKGVDMAEVYTTNRGGAGSNRIRPPNVVLSSFFMNTLFEEMGGGGRWVQTGRRSRTSPDSIVRRDGGAHGRLRPCAPPPQKAGKGPTFPAGHPRRAWPSKEARMEPPPPAWSLTWHAARARLWRRRGIMIMARLTSRSEERSLNNLCHETLRHLYI
jgi:hypothetical protein